MSLYCSGSIDAGLPSYDEGAYWRSIVEQSRAWRQQDSSLWEYMAHHYVESMGQTNDLDENARNMIVVHSHDEQEVAKYAEMMASISRFLSDVQPPWPP